MLFRSAGYATALSVFNKKVAAAWLSAHGNSLPNADQVRFTEITDVNIPSAFTPDFYGAPNGPLALDTKGIAFGCATRICKFAPTAGSIKLANGATSISQGGSIITIKDQRYLITTANEKLILVTL